MNLTDLLNTIILLGTIQGFISTILIYKIPKNKSTNRFLAILIFFITIDCLHIFLGEAIDPNVNSTIYHLFRAIVPLGIYMPIGPLIYLYLKALTEENFQFSKKDKLHFSTVLIDLVPYLIGIFLVLIMLLGLKAPLTSEENNFWGNLIYNYQKYMDIPRWISLSIYIWISYRYLNKLKKPRTQKTLQWARVFLSGFLYISILWLIYLIFYITPATSTFLVVHFGYYPIYIPLIIAIYWLGIQGFIMSYRIHKRNKTRLPFDSATIESHIKTLKESMVKNQLFFDSSLKVNTLAIHTKIPQKNISTLLNQHLNKSFNEFVNYYRVEEVKRRLTNPQYDYLTITGIAFDCGFNSQATFQRAFMHFVKMTPKAFRKERNLD